MTTLSEFALRVQTMEGVLKEVQTFFVNNWRTELRKDVNALGSWEASLRKLKDQVPQLEEQSRSATSTTVSAKLESTVAKSTDELMRAKESLSESLHQLNAKNKELNERLELQRKISTTKEEELQKSAGFYHEYLGMKLNKVRGGWLEVVFIQISKDNPEKPFFFRIKISDGIYVLGDCDPALRNVDALLTKLNETNNLWSFILEMRRRFTEFAAKHSSS